MEDAIKQLKELIGRKFSYKGKDILIKNAKKVGGLYVISADSKSYNFFESEVPVFLEELIEVPRVKLKEGILEKRQMELQQKYPNSNLEEKESDNLTKILLDTIQKVQTNKDYIGQANAICNVVSQMINIKKLELQFKKK